jgi:hypothetical protein
MGSEGCHDSPYSLLIANKGIEELPQPLATEALVWSSFRVKV